MRARRPKTEHLARPWRVHARAREFELLDVWRFPIRVAQTVPFRAYLEFMPTALGELRAGGGAAATLFRLRGWLGRRFRWDRPAPGTLGLGFTPVYTLDDETLAEIENETVHALIHLGRVPLPVAGGGASPDVGEWAPEMAVYVRPRGWLGRGYLLAITPFRHLIVYPAMMRTVARRWPDWARAHGWTR